MDSQQLSLCNSYDRSPRGRSRTPRDGPRGRSPRGYSPHDYSPHGYSPHGYSPHGHHRPPVQGEDRREYLTQEGESKVNAFENMLKSERKASKKKYDKKKEENAHLTATADVGVVTWRIEL